MKKILLPVLLSVVAAASSHAADSYHLLKEIPVGGDGGWDYLTLDKAGQRLFVSRGKRVDVVETAAGRITAAATTGPASGPRPTSSTPMT